MKRLLPRVGLLLGIMLLTSSAQPTLAADLRQYAMYYADDMQPADCGLVARYSPTQKKKISIAGRLDGKECLVTMTHQQFEDSFQFCYLAGINVYQMAEKEMIECVVQKRDADYLFLASGGSPGNKDSGQVMCYFSCIGVAEK